MKRRPGGDQASLAVPGGHAPFYGSFLPSHIPHQTRFDVHALLAELLSVLRARTDEKGLWLHLERSDEAPRRIATDHGKLRQTLVNLLGIALEFTSTDGVLLRVGLSGPPDTVWRTSSRGTRAGPVKANGLEP